MKKFLSRLQNSDIETRFAFKLSTGPQEDLGGKERIGRGDLEAKVAKETQGDLAFFQREMLLLDAKRNTQERVSANTKDAEVADISEVENTLSKKGPEALTAQETAAIRATRNREIADRVGADTMAGIIEATESEIAARNLGNIDSTTRSV